jgi:hypothetical protein
MLVGHLPFLSRLVSLLLVGDPDRPLVQFPMGGIVCLAREAPVSGGTPVWNLVWALTPAMASSAIPEAWGQHRLLRDGHGRPPSRYNDKGLPRVDGGLAELVAYLAVIGVLNSRVSVYYYVGVLVRMYMVEGVLEIPVPSSRP